MTTANEENRRPRTSTGLDPQPNDLLVPSPCALQEAVACPRVRVSLHRKNWSICGIKQQEFSDRILSAPNTPIIDDSPFDIFGPSP